MISEFTMLMEIFREHVCCRHAVLMKTYSILGE